MIRIAIVVAVVAAIAAAAFLLPVAEWTIALAEYARGKGAAGVALFFAAYIVSTVALIPGAILTLAAGFVYGPVWGLAVASPASVAAAATAFLLGRTVLHGWATRTVGASAKTRALDAAVTREGFKLVLLLRLSPLIPFNLLNYALSLSRLRFTTYVSASFLGMLPATALYVYLGSLAPAAAGLSTASNQGGDARNWFYIAGLAATIAVVVIGARIAKRALNAELSEAGE